MDEGQTVDFAGTITRHTERDGCDITTVNRVKVHVVDGVQMAKPGKEKKKGGVGRVLGEDDADDASPPPKKRVKGGAREQKRVDNQLKKDEPIEYDDAGSQKIAEGNDWLKQLAKERAARRG